MKLVVVIPLSDTQNKLIFVNVNGSESAACSASSVAIVYQDWLRLEGGQHPGCSFALGQLLALAAAVLSELSPDETVDDKVAFMRGSLL